MAEPVREEPQFRSQPNAKTPGEYERLANRDALIGKLVEKQEGGPDKETFFRAPVFFDKSMCSEEDVRTALSSRIFVDWEETMNKNDKIVCMCVLVQSVVFRPKSKDVEYIKINAECYTMASYVKKLANPDTKLQFLPGIAFLRGPCAAVLVVLRGEEEDFVVLTVQPRPAVAKYAFPELPRGFIDDTGDFVGEAAAELENHLQIRMSEMDLVDLTQLAFGDAFPGMYPSAGGCDEYVTLYLYRADNLNTKIEELRRNHTGQLKRGQKMALKIVPLKELWKVTPDSKSLSALAIYHRLQQSGILD